MKLFAVLRSSDEYNLSVAQCRSLNNIIAYLLSLKLEGEKNFGAELQAHLKWFFSPFFIFY